MVNQPWSVLELDPARQAEEEALPETASLWFVAMVYGVFLEVERFLAASGDFGAGRLRVPSSLLTVRVPLKRPSRRGGAASLVRDPVVCSSPAPALWHG